MDNVLFPVFEPVNPVYDLMELIGQNQSENSARSCAMKLLIQIRKFEENLDRDHEVGMNLVSFGQALTFHVTEIGYIQPNLVLFRGFKSENEPVELIQHISQLSFLLTKVQRTDPSQPKRQIGFIQPKDANTNNDQK